MTTKNLYLAFTALVGLAAGSAWSQARRMDTMVNILHTANVKVEASIEERNKAYSKLMLAEQRSTATKSKAKQNSVLLGKNPAWEKPLRANNNASQSSIVADSTVRDSSTKILHFDSSKYEKIVSPATSSIRLRGQYPLSASRL